MYHVNVWTAQALSIPLPSSGVGQVEHLLSHQTLPNFIAYYVLSSLVLVTHFLTCNVCMLAMSTFHHL